MNTVTLVFVFTAEVQHLLEAAEVNYARGIKCGMPFLASTRSSARMRCRKYNLMLIVDSLDVEVGLLL